MTGKLENEAKPALSIW